MRAHAMRRALTVIKQALEVFLVQALEDPRLELPRVRRCGSLTPGPIAKVVGQVTRADDEDVVFGKRPQGGAEVEVVARAERRLYLNLNDRDVRLRIHIEERRPRAVVEAPASIDAGREARILEKPLRTLGEGRSAGRRVTQPIERLGKVGKVVDGLGLR